MDAKTLSKVRCEIEKHVKAEADKDLLFSLSGTNAGNLMARLSEDDKRTIVYALKHYAASGASRAIDWLAKNGNLA